MLSLVNAADERLVELQTLDDPIAHDDEAIVDVRAFSLNRGELSLLKSRPRGWRPGQDIAGTVVVAARNGSGPRVGARVVGLVEQGGWSQRVAVRTSRLAEVPSGVDLAVAAALPIAGLTALRILRLGGALLGRRVLVTGADGGVGHYAVQLALRAGAHVTAIAAEESAQQLRAYGAEEVVADPSQAQGLFHLILESIGGASLEANIGKLAPGATLVLFGNSSASDAKLNLFQFFGHENAKIVTFFSYASPDDGSIAADLTELVQIVASGALKPQIASRSSWREFAHAAEALRDRALRGKAVFLVD